MVIFHSFLYVYQRVILILGNHYIVIPKLGWVASRAKESSFVDYQKIDHHCGVQGNWKSPLCFQVFFFSSDRCFPTVFFVRDEVGFKCSMFSPEVPLR